ncbi:osm1, partial [Symbiodinium sp. CCMP2456]
LLCVNSADDVELLEAASSPFLRSAAMARWYNQLQMGEETGAKSVDLEWVHVHPMGLAKPDDADAKMKFLAAEALRGVGGIILNAEGKRFCNELGRRDYVTGEMWKSKPPFRLCLNKAASDEINWHCKRYTGRGAFPPSLRFVRAEDSEHQLQQLDPNDFPMLLQPLGRTCRASDQVGVWAFRTEIGGTHLAT